MSIALTVATLLSVTWVISPAFAQGDVDELAKELANPVAALSSLPFQFNHDTNIGPDDDGRRIILTLQPVVRLCSMTTLGAQLEHTLDHENDMDTGQASVFLSKVTQIGPQMFSFGVIPKYWCKDSASSPEGFGI